MHQKLMHFRGNTSSSTTTESINVEPSNTYKQQMAKMESEAFSDPSIDNGMYSVQGMSTPSAETSFKFNERYDAIYDDAATDCSPSATSTTNDGATQTRPTRESVRREQQSRDQQFSMQQMSFMREMLRTKDNDGFFDSDMKGIFKQKMVENLLDIGSSNEAHLKE